MNDQCVAGMVTLYNSSTAVLLNIDTYIHQIETLYVIDNSDVQNYELITLLHTYSKIQYHFNNGNRGIGHALNKAADLARCQGYKYLLTMDDDSSTPTDLVSTMLSFWRTYTGGKIGLVSAIHSMSRSSANFKAVPYTMTSGNLLDLTVHEQVGGFWEDLFIDHIDHEYGLRLNSKGYQVIEIQSASLYHSLGERKPVFLWFRRWQFVSHKPFRMYYISRNGFLVAQRHWQVHPKFSWIATKLLIKELFKSLFLEDSRMQRVKFLLKGISDACKGKTGKLQ